MDPKLKLKPVELIDIGIDQITKIPIPVLNENIITTFDIENKFPVDSFNMTFNSNYGNFFMTMFSDYQISLQIDYGDSIKENKIISNLGTNILHTYSLDSIYRINISGWLDRVKTIIISPNNSPNGGLTSINYLNRLKKLSYIDLTNNRLTNIDISGMIYLNNVSLKDNYLTKESIDDLYINLDSFLTFSGNVDTSGIYNSDPTEYSESSIYNLTVNKKWNVII